MTSKKKEFAKDYFTVLSQQIPIFGSIIRDAKSLFTEKEFKRLLTKIQSSIQGNQSIIDNNLSYLIENSQKLTDLTKVVTNRFVGIDSTIDGILQILSSKNIEEKITFSLNELKKMELRLTEQHGINYEKEISKKLTALFFEIDDNIKWFNGIIKVVSNSLTKLPVKGKKEIFFPADKPRIAAIESFLSENWLDDPKALKLLSKVHSMTKGVETIHQHFFSSQDSDTLVQLVSLAKKADKVSFKALIEFGVFWRQKFFGTYPNYRREINKIYTCPKCKTKSALFRSPGILQTFCTRCQRPISVGVQRCSFCNKKKWPQDAIFDFEITPIEIECKACHTKILLENKLLELVFKDTM